MDAKNYGKTHKKQTRIYAWNDTSKEFDAKIHWNQTRFVTESLDFAVGEKQNHTRNTKNTYFKQWGDGMRCRSNALFMNLSKKLTQKPKLESNQKQKEKLINACWSMRETNLMTSEPKREAWTYNRRCEKTEQQYKERNELINQMKQVDTLKSCEKQKRRYFSEIWRKNRSQNLQIEDARNKTSYIVGRWID